MTFGTKPKPAGVLRRSAFGLALAVGVASGALIAQPALAAKPAAPAKISFSPAFSKAAAELDKTLTEAIKNPTIKAAADRARDAQDPQAKAAAVAEVETALGGGVRAKLDTVATAASTPGDKLKLGEMRRTYGVLTNDVALQHQGLVDMIDSGGVQPQSLGQIQFLAGVTAYQKNDYAGAVKYLEPAKASGYQDQQGLLDRVLADSYKRTGNNSGALAMAQRDIAAAKTAGTKPSETAIRSALQASYDAKQVGPSVELATMLVQNYPSSQAWGTSINVVRALSQYQSQEVLDLMRLMARTNSYSGDRDYIEHIQAADPRRLPGEVQKTIDAGVSAGKLRANDPFVAEAKTISAGRLSQDRSSLPSLDRDARAGNATAATTTGAADAFLSYGDAAKAEALYTLALAKPGVDSERALTRLGIAQTDQGKVAEAQANFAKVQGPRKPIAQLWSAYAQSKATPAAPAAPAQ